MSRVIPLAGAAFAATLLIGCAGRPDSSVTPVAPTEQAQALAQPTLEAIPTGGDAGGPDADECLACHADKQKLIDTAAPVEVEPSESSGVG